MKNNNLESATVVASEKTNVVNEATSINNLISNDMFEDRNEVAQTTRIAIINGEEVSIIIAHTEYGMEMPKDKKNLMGSLDKNKMLSCIFHLAKPEIFWAADMKLVGENNEPIEKDTANVYVLCPTADSYWRLAVEEKLQNVEVHDFANVQEYAQAVGCTNLYSRGLNNLEKMGVSALATGDEACKTVYDFAKENNLNVTTAKLYLDYRVKPTDILSMTMGVLEESRPELGRSKEEAQKLLDKALEKFGKNALKRYVIRAVNSILHGDDGYSLEQVKDAIGLVTETEVDSIKDANSADKESIISSKLTKWLLKDKKLEEAA